MKLSGNTILMTGGGSGIGAALAQRFHDLGNTVIITGRRRDALDKTAAGQARMHALPLDIANPATIAACAQQALKIDASLNVLINNAGIMRFEELEHHRDLSDANAMISTNLLGPIRMTNALIDHLVRQPNAAIINVTSGLAFIPLVAAPTYSATKAALHSYTVSLRDALRDRVAVIELAPPAVQTDLTPGQSTRPGYQPLAAYIDEVMTLFQQQPTPEEILVEQVKPLRYAEAEKQFADRLTKLNDAARRARDSQG